MNFPLYQFKFLFPFLVVVLFKSDLIGIECPTENSSSEPICITLGYAVERVIDDNRQIDRAVQNVDQSNLQLVLNEAEFDLAILPHGNAGYIGGGKAGTGPTLGGGVEFYKQFTLGTKISVKPMIIKAAHDFQSQLNVKITQPLLRGFGKFENEAAIEAARFTQRSAFRNLLKTKLSQILRAIQAVYDVKRTKELLALETESYERIMKFYEKTKRKEKIGLCDSLDIYRAEMEYKQAQDALELSKNRYQDVKDSLKNLLEIPLDTPIEVCIPDLEYHDITLCDEEAIALAMQYRIEIYQAWDAVKESRRNAKLTKARIWPELNLVIDFSNTGWNEEFTESFYRRRESTWGIGFTSSTDLDRTADKIAYKNSLYAIKDTERAYMELRDDIALEVKKVLRNLETIEARMQNLEEQVKSAKGGMLLAKIKYDRGMCSNFDVIQAEKAFQSAQVALFTTKVEHILSEFKLLATLGILGNPNNLSICCK